MTFVNGSDDPEVDLAARTLSRLLRERQLARYEAWQENRSSYPRAWRDAAHEGEYFFYLTLDEMRELDRELTQLLLPRFRERLTDPSARPKGAVPVELLVFAYPIALPPEP